LATPHCRLTGRIARCL